jgi:dTMP kinase
MVGFLRKGVTVLTSRYLASTPAFGYSEEEDLDFLIALQSKFFLPDLMFFLDVRPEVSLRRINSTRSGIDRFETLERLKKADKGYQILLKRFPGMMIPINGEEEVEVVMNNILVYILEHPKFRRLLRRPK